MRKCLWVLFVVVLFVRGVRSELFEGGNNETRMNIFSETGIIITTTQQSIQQHINSLLNNSQCFPISNHHGVISLSPFGQVYFKVDNIRLLEKIRGDVSISVVDGLGLKLVISNLQTKMSLSWFYNYKKFFVDIEDRGRGVLEVIGLNLIVLMKFDMGSEGSLSPKAAECEGTCGALNFKVGDGLQAFIYSPITSLVSFALRNPCHVLRLALDLLKDTPMFFPIQDKLNFNLSLTQPPLFKNESIRVFIRGEFLAIKANRKFLFRPKPLLEVSSSKLVNVQVSMASLYSALRSLVQDQFFKTIVSADDFAGPLKDHFKASCWVPTCLGFPFVQLKFGYSGYYISIEVELSKTPQLAVQTGGVYLKVNDLSVTLNATNNGTSTRLVTFYLTATFLIQPKLSPDATFHWSLEKKDFQIVKSDSDIGMVPTGMLQYVSESVFETLVLPKLNDLGNVGYKIILPACFSLINSDLHLNRNSLIVKSDLKLGI